jgi:outer membrane PBP1 activator LpoA protein
VDSFRLYARLDQLAQGELINFRGATGLLSMKETGAIERIPQTAVFVDGRTVRLEDTGSLVTN